MNKVLKGLVAVAATAAMAIAGVAGASTAMADPAATTTNITITDAAKGDEFGAYKLLNLTTSVEGETPNQTTNYSYTVNEKYRGVLTNAINELKANTVPTADGTAVAAKDKAIIDYVTNNVKENSATLATGQVTARAFAEKVREKLDADNAFKTDGKLDKTKADKNADASLVDSSDESKGYHAVFSDAEQGYYLIVQTKATSADGKTMSQVILDTHGQDATDVTVKKDTVTLTKKVQENQDGVANPDKDNWQDGADYNIGDDVPFKLTGTLPTDYANYAAYKYVFHDSPSTGLTVKKDSIEVYKNEVSEANKLAAATDSTGYKVSSAADDSNPFTVTFDNLKTAKMSDGNNANIAATDKIIVTYKATLNNQAKRGATGNPNEAWLEFSNDQYNTGEGSPTGNTPHDKVIVFTFDLVVNKYKNQVDPEHILKNAGFALYKSTDGKDWGTAPVKELKNDENNTNVFQFKGLDSGYYKIVETKVPDGFTKADDVIFKVVASYDTESVDPSLTNLVVKDANDTVISTGENAKFTLTGIKYDGSMSANAQINTNIVNKSGSRLPSTGGMGTTILYVAGAAIVLVAAFGIAFAVRRRNAR
ncbi:FimA fimbrial subunit-like protein [Bifidobacterium porcinum]|nr:FimA fimbrial subunit-like protein [Bifidobacterium porcinum]